MVERKSSPWAGANLFVTGNHSRFAGNAAVTFKVDGSASEQIHFGVFLEEPDLPGKTVPEGKIVGIHSRQVFAQTHVDQFIESKGEPPGFGVRQQPDSSVLKSLDPGHGPVAGAVVGDEQLPILISLSQD